MENWDFNKIASAVLMVTLSVLLVNWVAEERFHPHGIDPKTGFPIEIPEVTAGGEAEEDVPIDWALVLATADIGKGARHAAACKSCHTFEEGGAHGTGPALWDIMGRTAGTIGSFGKYSDAMVTYGATWDYETLNTYLEAPKKVVPGTAMNYNGMKKEQKRIELIAYLRSLSDTPYPLPEPLPAIADTVTDVVVDAASLDADYSTSSEGLSEGEGNLIEESIEGVEEVTTEFIEDVNEAVDDAIDAAEKVTAGETTTIDALTGDLPEETDGDETP